MRKIKFEVNKEVLDLGVKILTAQVTGTNIERSNPEFESYKTVELDKLKTQWKNMNYKNNSILEGFRYLHTNVGRSNRDYIASPEVLRRLFLEKDKFPQINVLVDIYNLISLKTGLALGAHDIDKISGNVTLRFTKGDEHFIPLGSNVQEKVFPGEYGYIDDGNNIICRLEVLQVEPTKITTETQNVFLIIQGNANTSNDFIKKHAEELMKLIIKYCGGKFVYINKLN